MRFIKLALAGTSLFAVTSFTLHARAQETRRPPSEENFRQVAITTNPLSFLLLRAGVNFEFLPIKHHAIVINPYFQRNVVDEKFFNVTIGEGTYTTVGAEAGYRFYSGTTGASGLFVGPSMFVQRTHAVVPNMTVSIGPPPTDPTIEQSMTVYGGIIDIGGQMVTKDGFTIGAGAGLMYMWSTSAPSETATSRYNGILPRLLLTVGYSF